MKELWVLFVLIFWPLVALAGDNPLTVHGSIIQGDPAALSVVGSPQTDADVSWIWVGSPALGVNQGVSVAFNSIQPSVGYNAWAFRVWPNFTTAGAGTHPELIGARLELPGVVSGGAGVNRLTALKIFGPSILGGTYGALSNYAIWSLAAAGDIRLDGASFEAAGLGPHAFGGSAVDYRQWRLTGTFQPPASTAGSNSLLWIDSTLVSESGKDAYGLHVEPAFIRNGAVTLYAGTTLERPVIQDAANSWLNYSATLFLRGSPVGAVGINNLALYVGSGTTRLDGPLNMGGAAGYNGTKVITAGCTLEFTHGVLTGGSC